MNSPRSLHGLLMFTVLSLLFGSVAVLLLNNHYVSDPALFNWSSMTAIFDAPQFRLENLGFSHTHGPMLILAPISFLPGVGAIAPYLVSVGVVAILFTLWHRHLLQNGYPLSQRMLLLLVMAINPAIVWGATSGGGEAVSLLMFYLLYRSCLRMVYEKDIRSFIALGLVLAAFFYFDVISIFLFVALLPLLVLVAPVPMLRESPVSVYIIIGMPLLIIMASWIFFNWIFLGDPLAFLHTYDSAFTGARLQAEILPWLRDYGGQLFVPMMIGLGYVVFGYPVLLFLIKRSNDQGRMKRISLVLMFHPAIAIGLATWVYFLASPLQISVLLAASVMAEISRLGCVSKNCIRPLVTLLIVGAGTNAYLFLHDEDPLIKPWTAALIQVQQHPYPADTALGEWLAKNREATLLDFQSGYRAIATRGDARSLLLPFSPEFHLAMHSERPTVPQIAVPDPDVEDGRRDAINERFPQLYESGLPGYKRVYDHDGWRVYRRKP